MRSQTTQEQTQEKRHPFVSFKLVWGRRSACPPGNGLLGGRNLCGRLRLYDRLWLARSCDFKLRVKFYLAADNLNLAVLVLIELLIRTAGNVYLDPNIVLFQKIADAAGAAFLDVAEPTSTRIAFGSYSFSGSSTRATSSLYSGRYFHILSPSM